MPTWKQMELPRPKTWQEFEDITCDALKLSWESPNLQKNGRAGQAQNGVDIYGPDNFGRLTGIQCKKTDQKLDIKIIIEEIENAESFTPKLNTLYIATTTDNDVHLQKEVRKISEKRAKQDKFSVGLLFWEDIVSGLIRNSQIFQSHYPNIKIPNDDNSFRHTIPAFELGFYGGNTAEFINLILGEFGQMANEDPDKVNIVLDIIEDHCQLFLPSEKFMNLKKCKNDLIDYLFTSNAERIEEHNIKMLADRITARVENCNSFLTPKQQQAFSLGKQLGFSHLDCSPESTPDDAYDQISAKIITFLGNQVKKDLDKLIKKLKEKKNSSYSWERDLRNFIVHALRWQI